MIPRFLHKFYAWFNNYFWIPCPKCGRPFGGHETEGGTLFDYHDGYVPGVDAARKGRVTCSKCPGLWEERDGEIYPIWGRVFVGIEGSLNRRKSAK